MALSRLAPYQAAALFNPFKHFAMIGGIGTGKTHAGSEFTIKMLKEHPRLRGFIGANTYDQLSQATLMALYEAFETHNIQYVADKMPPIEWGEPKRFKKYQNIISVRQRLANGEFAVTYIFIRVLSKADRLRGIEFSWYWIDESRDTPQYTHNVILGRMRESKIQKGLVTTTSNGRDWVFSTFVQAPKGQTDFGCLHVKTIEAVHLNIIDMEYYRVLRRSYTPLLAMQELDALHVNTTGGRAYYAAGDHNRRHTAPWGGSTPDPRASLIVGCDFNFSPAPCVWEVGQLGVLPDGRRGIHWFREFAQKEASTPDMVRKIAFAYPGFTLQFFGDASGTKGTTSNHGESDTVQIGQTCRELGVVYTLDYDQGNPRVKNRVENVNRCSMNAMNEITMTYDPAGCPLLDGDLDVVGWKKMVAGRNTGRLDDGGDVQRTHASDAVGYALWKLFPLEQYVLGGGTIKSQTADVDIA